MNSWAVDSLPVVPMEVRSPAQAALELSREEVHNRPERRHDTSESGFAELLRDLSLTPPPVLDSQLSVPSASMPGSHPSQPSEPPPSEPPLPAGPPSPDLHHFSRQRSSEDPDRAGSEDVRRHSRRISWGDGGLPFDLVNNDYIKAMQHMYSNNLGGSWALNADDMRMLKEHSQYVDWTMEKNLQSLKDIRKVVRSIFWGFEDIQCQDDADAPAPVMTEDLLSRLKRLAQYTVEGKAFTLFYVFLTLYALFGPDTLLAAGHSGMDQDNLTLSIVNIFVFLAFVVEELLMCWVVPGYLFSLRFFMDTCATISILGDTAIAAEIINTDAAVAMRSSGVTRAMRGAGRSTRFVSVLRGLRVWQILKLLPRLQRLTESGTRELAMLMWHKRLQNVMGYIDKEGMGELNDEDMEFLTAALRLEFPAPPHEEAGCISRLVDKIQESGSRSSWTWPWRRKAQAVEPDLSRYSAEIHSCWDTDMGKRAFRRCLDDITTMKESCTVLYQSMLRLILKPQILWLPGPQVLRDIELRGKCFAEAMMQNPEAMQATAMMNMMGGMGGAGGMGALGGMGGMGGAGAPPGGENFVPTAGRCACGNFESGRGDGLCNACRRQQGAGFRFYPSQTCLSWCTGLEKSRAQSKAARLKSLNTRYGTQLLVSSETLQSSVGELFVARTVGRLILKGRTSPTHTLEVIGRKGQVPQDLEQAAEFHEEAAGLFAQGRFEEAKVLFEQASQVFVQYDEGSCPQDKPSAHMLDLCNMYHKNPPDLEKWDGSEHLNKKAWS
ncbi:unnamed protein product [Effrenium voratum]|nr:unnamed protein product [Effrenium voratum]